MCIITLVPLNLEMPTEAIEKGACANPDGHGWVVASEEHGLVMGKDMAKDKAIEACVAERERQGLNSVVLFHSRIGTHGSKTIENVHPFYVPDHTGEGHDMSTVMAHNGIMPSVWHPEHRDPRSDTRVFADRMATFYLTERGVPSRRGAHILGQMIGTNNKLVFLSTRLPGRPLTRIVNSTSGVWDNGIWYSNESYKRPRYPARTTSNYQGSNGKTCGRKDCNVTFYGTNSDTECYKHRQETEKAGKKATPVTTGTVTKDSERGPGWVSPYGGSSKPDSWNGYGIYPGAEEGTAGEIDAESEGLLVDIEKTLAEFDEQVKAEDLDSNRKCDVCRTKGTVHSKTNICVNCKWCLDCYQQMTTCTCFDYAAWWARRIAESEELAAAMAADAEADANAEAEQAAAEAAEERWLAQTDEEQIQVLRDFYGMTHEQAAEVVRDYKREGAAVSDALDMSIPKSTNPSGVKAGR